MLIMIGSFLENSQDASKVRRSDLRQFMRDIETCLGIRKGPLTCPQYGKLLTQLDQIVPFKYGELTEDLEAIDRIVNAYGDTIG